MSAVKPFHRSIQTLVLGILPSEKPKPFEWHAHADMREAARSSWLTLRPSDVITRFVVVDEAVPRGVKRNGESLKEARRHGDIVQLSAGGTNGSVCYLAELAREWFSHALSTWPNALYYGKTEDDIYGEPPCRTGV